MSTTVQSVAATLIEKVANDLIATVRTMPEDKAQWEPTPDTRSVINQVVECCLANRMWGNTLQTQVHARLPEGVAEQAYKELTTIEKVTAHLQETSDQLAAIVRNLPDEALPVVVPYPWKPEAGNSVAECCFHPYWNMVYHQGQINFIQTLYGDQEEHCDAGPFGERTELV